MSDKNIFLDVVLPTYNNPKCIEYILEKIERYSQYDYVLSIFDSSTNDETQAIVEKRLSEKITYTRIDSSIDVDEKTLIAVKSSTADFVYLSADGYLPKIDNIFKAIESRDSQSEIIALYDEDWNQQKKYYDTLTKFVYDDKDEFFEKHFWQIILYGGSVCKRELIQRIDVAECVRLFNGSGFIYPCSLTMYSLGRYESKIGKFIELVPFKAASGWITNKTAIKIWAKNFYETLKLPELGLNPGTADKIIRTTGKNTGFLTFRGLLHLKVTRNFTFNIYRKYSFYIIDCKACSAFSAFMLAISPTFIFILMRKVYKLIKK